MQRYPINGVLANTLVIGVELLLLLLADVKTLP